MLFLVFLFVLTTNRAFADLLIGRVEQVSNGIQEGGDVKGFGKDSSTTNREGALNLVVQDVGSECQHRNAERSSDAAHLPDHESADHSRASGS